LEVVEGNRRTQRISRGRSNPQSLVNEGRSDDGGVVRRGVIVLMKGMPGSEPGCLMKQGLGFLMMALR
jgi:hypothetical protein